MSLYQKVGVQSYDVNDVFSLCPDAERKVLCTYANDTDKIEAVSNTFTIVMNRNIRRSVEIASMMAIHLAKKFPEQKVLLVNTYAGTELMQRSLVAGLAESGGKVAPEHAHMLPHAYKDCVAQDEPPTQFPANLRIMDSPTGMLDAWRIEEELNLMGCIDEGSGIVLLNSFEFAAWGFDRDKKQFAEQLVELRKRRSLTMVIFSHEIRADVQNYTPAHGAIGVISAFAGSVWYLMRQADHARFNAHYKRIAALTNCGPHAQASR